MRCVLRGLSTLHAWIALKSLRQSKFIAFYVTRQTDSVSRIAQKMPASKNQLSIIKLVAWWEEEAQETKHILRFHRFDRSHFTEFRQAWDGWKAHNNAANADLLADSMRDITMSNCDKTSNWGFTFNTFREFHVNELMIAQKFLIFHEKKRVAQHVIYWVASRENIFNMS